MKIQMENESGKHYFSLNTAEFTLYPEEKEILLQAGIVGRVVKYEKVKDLNIFHIKISERWVLLITYMKTVAFWLPFIFFAIGIFYYSYYLIVDQSLTEAERI